MILRKKLFWQICCLILSQKLVILCTFLVSGAGKPQIIIFCNLWFLISCLTLSKNRKSQFTNLWYFWLSGTRYKKVNKITNFCDKIWQQNCQKRFFLGITCQSLDLKNCQKWVLLLHKVLEISLKSKSVFSKSCLKWKIFVTKVPSEIG